MARTDVPPQEPLAITGIGCRFPGGAHGPDEFWQLLVEGRDAITEVPADRWSLAAHHDPGGPRPGKTYSRWGGFVPGFEDFDPAFFGISAAEAACVDPQQRALLEVAWEALEDGGHALSPELAEATGVFVGISTVDYLLAANAPTGHREAGPFSSTGTATSIVANRISYALDLGGPSVALDTACSSSLVALHLACQSLWQGESRLALVGGVNYVLLPVVASAFSMMSALARDGRCKPFDARADGFVRGEGAGVVVVRPLSHALRDGDRIYATVLATGVNQDGRTAGMTLPSRQAQERLSHAVCRGALVEPADVGYVEAHGTGTAAGDPIEAAALGAVFGASRPPDAPCLMGSVKSNIGHLEAAAGIAGLVKLALVLERGKVPATLHFETPNPAIDFATLGLRVPTALEPLPENGDGSRYARLGAINSFGFGGTNAHAVLAGPPILTPAPVRARPDDTGGFLLTLSARSDEALRAGATRLAQRLEEAEGRTTAEICLAAATRRAHHSERAAVVARDRAGLIEALRAFAAGDATRVAIGRAVTNPDPVFVFSGQGQQWPGMGRELFEREQPFRDAIESCHEALRSLAEWSLVDELLAPPERSRLAETAIAQPAIVAFQIALAALLESLGVRPAAVLGHSVGEVAAAHVAGALDVASAMRVIYHRGRTMDTASSKGRMLAVGLSAADVAQDLTAHSGTVALAAVNSPRSVTLSGDARALDALSRAYGERGVFSRFVPVEYAFHSGQMDPVREPLLVALDGLEPGPSRLPMYSTVTGNEIDGSALGADYWWRNVRETVRFAHAVEALREASFQIFVEVAAHPVLRPSLHECVSGTKGAGSGRVVSTLARDADEGKSLRDALVALYCHGHAPTWSAPASGSPSPHVDLPRYAWQHERYWSEAEAWTRLRARTPPHPLLAEDEESPVPTWGTSLEARCFPYLGDHVVLGRGVFPGAGYVEMGLAAARAAFGSRPILLEDVEFERALLLGRPEAAPPRILLRHDVGDGSFEIHARRPGEDEYVRHARGRLRLDERADAEVPDLPSARERCRETIEPAEFYRRCSRSGLEYGPAFQCIRALWSGEGETLARVELPEALAAESSGYVLHPALLDACFQAIAWQADEATVEEQPLYLPSEVTRVRLLRSAGSVAWCHARLQRRQGAPEAEFRIYDPEGRLVAEIEGFRCRAVAGTARDRDPVSWFHSVRWEPAPRLDDAPGPSPPGDFVPPVAELAGPLAAAVARFAAATEIPEQTRRFQPDADELRNTYLFDAIEELGGLPAPGTLFTAGQLAVRLAVAEPHQRVLELYLRHLSGAGWLERGADGAWTRHATSGPASRADSVWRRLAAAHPAASADLALLRRIGANLAPILRGDLNALEHLFGQGGVEILEALYSRSPLFRPAYAAAAELLHEIVRRCPEGRELRILEAGAGTGGLTSHLLPLLDPLRTRYVSTDVSTALFERNRLRFKAYPHAVFQVLDLETEPTEQGFEEGSFDVVVAADAVHATRDLARSLKHLRKLLAPGGLLALLEFEAEHFPREMDLLFGVLDGWWLFEDRHRRPDHVIPARQAWLSALEEAGFDAVAVDTSPDPGHEQHTVFVGRPRAVAAEVAPTRSALSSEMAWLLLADDGGVGRELSRALGAGGARCVRVSRGGQLRQRGEHEWEVDPRRPDELRSLLDRAFPADTGPVHVVYLWALDAPATEDLGLSALDASQDLVTRGALCLAQAVATRKAIRLTLVTRGAQDVGSAREPLSLAQTPLNGFARVLMQEIPDLHCRTVDLDPLPSRGAVQTLLAELTSPDDEEQIALRGEGRFRQRVVRWIPGTDEEPVPVDERPCRLEIGVPGSLQGLVVRPHQERAPGPGEVAISVRAAALNFRDVLKALGVYPSDASDALVLGDECAGVVTAVGKEVGGIAPGDRVAAFGFGSFATHVVVDARAVVPLPPDLPLESAAGLVVAYLTAHCCLHGPGRLSRGERVLIHSGAGGVGLAAIRLATSAGAEVFATAGSHEKRELLRALGVAHVMDSRSLAFADETLRLTAGEGVDVVLNSLAGEALRAGLSVLREGGRFVEIGKRDIYGGTRIDLRPFRKRLTFSSVDLAAGEAWVFEHLRRVAEAIAAGRIAPLPYEAFDFARAEEAFEHMARARHAGKVCLSLAGARVRLAPRVDRRRPGFRPDATWLVTGGVRGLGLSVAQWLARRGVRHLVLTGRSGPSEEARPVIERLERDGVKVWAVASDVAEDAALRDLLHRIESTMPPLRGVIHAAMVLDDAVVERLDTARLDRVMAPKALGAWNLHHQTLDLPIEHFVLFSSAASIAGNPGQANYAAANAFLESLAGHRRRLGLPALTVAWSAVSDAGYVSRESQLAEHLSRVGIDAMNTAQVHRILELALVNGTTVVHTLLPSGLRAFGRRGRRFSELASPPDESTTDSADLRRRLQKAPAAERQQVLEAYLMARIAEMSRTAPSELSPERALSEVGLDSLSGIELVANLEATLGVAIGASTLMGAGSITDLAQTILGSLGLAERTPTVPQRPPARGTTRTSEVRPDPRADVGLADDLSFPELPLPPSTGGDQVLLTGATGFLGAYLLDQLLDQEDRRVVCLVRADSDEAARARVIANLSRYGLAASRNGAGGRLTVVAGDLERPRLGLGGETYEDLAGRTHAVFHNGAAVNHVFDYDRLRGTNVLGTLEALRFAAAGRPKAIHYTSTLAVFRLTGDEDREILESLIGEDDVAGLVNGYAQTKWVSERMLERAAARGARVSVYRPGIVIADRATGLLSEDDFLWRLVRTSIDLGVGPGSDAPLLLTPVDFAARAIAHLSRSDEAAGRVFHLVSPPRLSVRDILNLARERGYSLQLAEPGAWTRMASERTAHVAPYLVLTPEEIRADVAALTRLPRISTRNTDAGLEETGIRAHTVDAVHIETVFRSFVRRGILREPPRSVEVGPRA